ncbi:MAG TPA: carbohydrate ABC transporter permease [Rectinemataceae bacterium]|nr:carbohydrate ABC transporter permease [Rectinemataceae bacterium]
MVSKNTWWFRILRAALLAGLLFWTLAPVYIVVSNAFRRTLDIKKMPPELLFKPIALHFQRLFELDDFLKYFANSIVISASVTLVTLALGTLAAYGMKLFRSRIGERLSNFLLIGKLVPGITILIPLYIMLNRAHITGTYLGPILAHSAMGLPFITWLMTSFVWDIPKETIESACIEGCSRMRTFWHVVFPMLTPALASAAILIMQSSWNELLFSLQLTNINTYPLTVGIARYVGAISVDWGKCSAAATISMLPIIAAGFFMQRYLVAGMTAGAVKG